MTDKSAFWLISSSVNLLLFCFLINFSAAIASERVANKGKKAAIVHGVAFAVNLENRTGLLCSSNLRKTSSV